MTIEDLEKLFKGRDKKTTIVLARDSEGRVGFSPLSATSTGNFVAIEGTTQGSFQITDVGGNALALFPLG